MTSASTMARLEHRGLGKSGGVPLLTSVLVASQLLGASLDTRCGGRGRCGACAFLVIDGRRALSPPTAIERRFRLPDKVRLGCQARVLSDLVFEAWTPPVDEAPKAPDSRPPRERE